MLPTVSQTIDDDSCVRRPLTNVGRWMIELEDRKHPRWMVPCPNIASCHKCARTKYEQRWQNSHFSFPFLFFFYWKNIKKKRNAFAAADAAPTSLECVFRERYTRSCMSCTNIPATPTRTLRHDLSCAFFFSLSSTFSLPLSWPSPSYAPIPVVFGTRDIFCVNCLQEREKEHGTKKRRRRRKQNPHDPRLRLWKWDKRRLAAMECIWLPLCSRFCSSAAAVAIAAVTTSTTSITVLMRYCSGPGRGVRHSFMAMIVRQKGLEGG